MSPTSYQTAPPRGGAATIQRFGRLVRTDRTVRSGWCAPVGSGTLPGGSGGGTGCGSGRRGARRGRGARGRAGVQHSLGLGHVGLRFLVLLLERGEIAVAQRGVGVLEVLNRLRNQLVGRLVAGGRRGVPLRRLRRR